MKNYVVTPEWEDFDEFFQRSRDHYTSVDLSKHLNTVNYIIDRLIIEEGFESKIQVLEYIGDNAQRISRLYNIYCIRFFAKYPKDRLYNNSVDQLGITLNSTIVDQLYRNRKSQKLTIRALSGYTHQRFYNQNPKLKG